jgi:hypothetical protein
VGFNDAGHFTKVAVDVASLRRVTNAAVCTSAPVLGNPMAEAGIENPRRLVQVSRDMWIGSCFPDSPATASPMPPVIRSTRQTKCKPAKRKLFRKVCIATFKVIGSVPATQPLASRARDNGKVRKRIGSSVPTSAPQPVSNWMDLGQIATVEVTSEDPEFPIESVFGATGGVGWRAGQKGEQQLRLIFDQAVHVRRIQLHFEEPRLERLQEFTVRWSAADGGQVKEIVRQQWNFSPAGSTSETEDYEVDLDGVSTLELVIRPDLTHNQAIATLAWWRVG